jgi:phosphoglycolate phosphatase
MFFSSFLSGSTMIESAQSRNTTVFVYFLCKGKIILTRVFIFDFDGVLADTEEPMLRFSKIACAELGYPVQPSRADLEAVEQMSFANLGRQLGLREEHIPTYVQRSLELFSENLSPLKIFPGMAEVLIQVSKEGSIGIVSGNTSRTIAKFLDYYHLSHTVQIILGADNPGTKPEKIEKILSNFSPAGGAIFVGDTASDVRAARESLIASVAVTWGHHGRQKLIEARPDYLVASPKELLSILIG